MKENKDIPLPIRKLVIKYYQWPFKKPVDEIASLLEISERSVRRVISAWQATGKVKPASTRKGRRRMLTMEDVSVSRFTLIFAGC